MVEENPDRIHYNEAVNFVESTLKEKGAKSPEARAIMDTRRSLQLKNEIDEIKSKHFGSQESLTAFEALTYQARLSTLGGELGALNNSMRDRQWDNEDYASIMTNLEKQLDPVRSEEKLQAIDEAIKKTQD